MPRDKKVTKVAKEVKKVKEAVKPKGHSHEGGHNFMSKKKKV